MEEIEVIHDMLKNRKLNRIISSIALILCVASVTTYAWFASNLRSNGDLNFTTSKSEAPLTLMIGRVTNSTIADSSAKHAFNTTVEAVKLNDDGTVDTRTFYYPTKDDNRPSAGGTVVLNDVTLGKIDNLVEPKPDNIVYLRLTIPSGTGDTLRFALSYKGTNHMAFCQYDANGLITALPDSDTTTLTALKQIEIPADATAPACSYLQYQYVLTDALYADGEALEATTPAWSENVNFYEYGYTDADGADPNISTTDSRIEETVDSTKTYYLYIRVTPNLAAYAAAMNIISQYPVSFMDFDIQMQFEVAAKS